MLSGIQSGLCSLYGGFTTYCFFYHQLSRSLEFAHRESCSRKQNLSPVFPLIKIIVKHPDVLSLIPGIAELMLFDK